MKKYRKKPIVVEAWNNNEEWREDILKEFPGMYTGVSIVNGLYTEYLAFDIDDFETVKIYDGDWVIKDVEGNPYPCRQSVFEATYEEVEG